MEEFVILRDKIRTRFKRKQVGVDRHYVEELVASVASAKDRR